MIGREKNPDEDVKVANRLRVLGFSVTNLVDKEMTPDKLNGYDLIYVSQTTNSKYLRTGIMRDVAIPTLYAKNHGMYYLGLSKIEEDAETFNTKAITIVDPNHPVVKGYSGTIDVYKEAGDKFGVDFGLPGKNAKILATVAGQNDKAAIYYYNKGAKADNGYVTKARISFIFIHNGMHENMTDAAWKILDNLVLWTLQNGTSG